MVYFTVGLVVLKVSTIEIREEQLTSYRLLSSQVTITKGNKGRQQPLNNKRAPFIVEWPENIYDAPFATTKPFILFTNSLSVALINGFTDYCVGVH